MGATLLTCDDVVAAARQRLRSWTPEQIDTGLAAVEAARKASEPLQAVCATGVLDHDPRVPQGAYCALLVLLAHAAGDLATLFSAGAVVLAHARQSVRGSMPREKDPLGTLIETHLKELPEIRPIDLWREFQRVAEDGFDPVLLDYHAETGELEYQSGPTITTIGFEAFRRRVQLLRRKQMVHC